MKNKRHEKILELIRQYPISRQETMIEYLSEAGFEVTQATVSRDIRQRFDGEKRNPYNEFECGSNYARSLASYGLLVALSGFQYDRNAGMLGFCPKYSSTSFQAFWALGDVWGSFRQDEEEAVITVMHGTFTLKELRLNRTYAPITLPLTLKTGDSLTVKFNPGAQC
jgi:hypothetical protein